MTLMSWEPTAHLSFRSSNQDFNTQEEGGGCPGGQDHPQTS